MSEQLEDVQEKRPWLAALLAVIVPGLGHIYIRMWLRAALWFALYFVTIEFMVPSEALPDSASFSAFADAGAAVPPAVALLVLMVSITNIIDAYLLTKQQNNVIRRHSGDAPASCPHCGKDLDEDLEFCHWCTTPLDAGQEAETDDR